MLYIMPAMELVLYLARGHYKNNLWDPRRHPYGLTGHLSYNFN